MTNAIWICESCGWLSSDTCCQECPVGSPGYSVEQIKDQFRACKTIDEVNKKAKAFGEHVKALQATPDGTVMGLQIINLARYKRKVLSDV